MAQEQIHDVHEIRFQSTVHDAVDLEQDLGETTQPFSTERQRHLLRVGSRSLRADFNYRLSRPVPQFLKVLGAQDIPRPHLQRSS